VRERLEAQKPVRGGEGYRAKQCIVLGSNNSAHDICAICIALSLSATSLLPVVTSLSLPVAYEWEWPANVQSAQVVFALKSYYQARAPPRA
jgi:hypothetical protein